MTLLDENPAAGLEQVSRNDVEEFIYDEAALLDEWRLEEWLDLFTLDCVYEVPAADTIGLDLDGGLVYCLIHDRRPLLEQRVLRLKKPTAHAEYPHSRTRRLVTNVRIVERREDALVVTANFAVFRSRYGNDICYVGRYQYELVMEGGHLRIKHRKAVLEHDALSPHGKISIII